MSDPNDLNELNRDVGALTADMTSLKKDVGEIKIDVKILRDSVQRIYAISGTVGGIFGFFVALIFRIWR